LGSAQIADSGIRESSDDNPAAAGPANLNRARVGAFVIEWSQRTKSGSALEPAAKRGKLMTNNGKHRPV